jgi:hypothetical protein
LPAEPPEATASVRRAPRAHHRPKVNGADVTKAP